MNTEFLPVLPICLLGMVMALWGDKIVKKNAKLVKNIGNVCFWTSLVSLVFAGICLVLAVLFPENRLPEWMETSFSVVLASGFALGMVNRTICWKLPEEMRD